MEWYFRRQLIQLSPAEQIELIGKAQQGDAEAASRLLRSLYPLIIREVNKKVAETLHINIGEPLPYAQLAEIKGRQALMNHLRQVTYSLAKQ